MIRIFSNVESIRYSAYHIIKAFFQDEDAAQENSLPPGSQEDLSGREYLCVYRDEQILLCSADKLDKHETDILLYDTLKKLTGRELPWGVLTGVRPVKLAMEQLDKQSRSGFIEHFRKERRVGKRKAGLAYDIAVRERRLIRSVLQGKDRDLGSFSIYVGIPICPSICSYCSFSSGLLSVWKDRLDEYIDALTGELAQAAGWLKDLSLTSIYIGGGTPTVLTEKQMERLLGCLRDNYHAEKTAEYTLEAGRPDTITKEKLELAKSYGVSRLSINPQSMQQKTLDLVGRRHSTGQIVEAFELARELGFDNINMDVIAGLPGETARDMADTISRISVLRPENLTVHALAVKRAAALGSLKTDSRVIDEMIDTAAKGAETMGMYPYYMYRQKSIAGNHENTGYAIPGRECIYNVMIMEEVQSIFAFGAGATTKILLKEKVQNPDRAKGVMTDMLRQDNVSSIADYISRWREMAETKEKTFDIGKVPCYYT
ncbi:MAG: coproporphyrinogen dehydrogenase HemZ [Lachnospiraceae bacterium]|nr:coproporphyrinogen dehydrogenase HemZ [Lachnospiraceae bacterium]